MVSGYRDHKLQTDILLHLCKDMSMLDILINAFSHHFKENKFLVSSFFYTKYLHHREMKKTSILKVGCYANKKQKNVFEHASYKNVIFKK